MLYVIPFILLLVILIVLKKRESSNNEKDKANAKSTTARKTSKKNATKTARSSQRQASNTQAVADDIIIEKKTTTLTAELKQNIEQLIREKNFFSAEAKINQALNKDNSQHELYLYLLDVHLAHKDDFAIDQLIKYVHSLGLEDIVQQAEAKQKVYAEEHKSHNTIELTQAPTETKPVSQTKKKHAAFDALVDTNAAQLDLQQQFNNIQSTSIESAPLEFSFSKDDAAAPKVIESTQTTNEKVDENQPLEFSFSKDDAAPKATESSQTTNEKVDENQPLDFSFVQDSPVPVTIEEPQTTAKQSAEIQPLEFSFDTPAVEAPAVIHTDEPVQKSEIQPLDFSFDLSPKTEVPLDTALEPTTPKAPDALTLDLAEATVEQTEVSTPALAEFDFKFEMPTAAPQSSLSLDLETIPLTTELPVMVEPLAFEPAQAVDSIAHSDDPLAQAFPGLMQSDEMQLNLELAAQYIELGAYTSAQQLLNQDPQQYSAEQLAQSQSLLNRIAS